MSRTAQSLFAFGIYVLVLGMALLVAPGLILDALRVGHQGEVWLRLVGVLTVNIGMLYVVAARAEFLPIIRASVLARLLLTSTVVTIVVLGWVEPQVLLFGAADLGGAAWTIAELRRG